MKATSVCLECALEELGDQARHCKKYGEILGCFLFNLCFLLESNSAGCQFLDLQLNKWEIINTNNYNIHNADAPPVKVCYFLMFATSAISLR